MVGLPRIGSIGKKELPFIAHWQDDIALASRTLCMRRWEQDISHDNVAHEANPE